MEMTTPFLSIIVPVYNVEQYLPRCIDSILAQTFTDFELILVDDGSSDNSGKICDEYAEKDTRIIVIHKENGGVSSARNRALDIVRGKYITFVDSDDQIGTLTTYEENIKILRDESEIDVIQYPIAILDENGIKEVKVSVQCISDTRSLFLKWYTGDQIRGYVCDKIFKRHIFNQIRFPEGMQLAEDAFCIVDFVQIVRCLYISEKGCYYYFQRESSAIRTFSPKKCWDMFMCEFKHFQFLCTLSNIDLESSHYFFRVYKDYLNTLIAYKGKINLKTSFDFIKEHIPRWRYVKQNSDFKNRIWYFLFLIFGIKFCSFLYVQIVLVRQGIKAILK